MQRIVCSNCQTPVFAVFGESPSITCPECGLSIYSPEPETEEQFVRRVAAAVESEIACMVGLPITGKRREKMHARIVDLLTSYVRNGEASLERA
jgi:DNA-directed RNA polymerase subunit RPC12/RpoP